MDSHSMRIDINDAPDQAGRRPLALEPGYADVDGRGAAELLDFALRFAALTQFYDLENRPAGDWVGFFLSDPAGATASILGINPGWLVLKFRRIEEHSAGLSDFPRKLQFLRRACRLIVGLDRRIEACVAAIRPMTGGDAGRSFRREVVDAIGGSLGEGLRRLKSYDLGAARPGALDRPIGLDFRGFSAEWELGEVLPDSSIFRGHSLSRKVDHAFPRVGSILVDSVDAVNSLRDLARSILPEMMHLPGRSPHIALFLAFIKLFQAAQGKVNGISNRYIQFYYRDVLRARERTAIADRVFLTFSLEPTEGLEVSPVPRASLFPAGQGRDGEPILFASDLPLDVTAASLARIRTLRVSRARLGPDGPTVVQRVRTLEILAAVDQETPPEIVAPWDTFGSADPKVGRPATLGFAVASATLHLVGGSRTVTFAIRFDPAYRETVLGPRLDRIAQMTGVGQGEVLRLILRKAFRLRATTAKGWSPISSYSIQLSEESEGNGPVPLGFILRFQFPPTAPPVVPIDSSVGPDGTAATADSEAPDETNPSPDLPTIASRLRHQAVWIRGLLGSIRVAPISVLDDIRAERLLIRVRVSGLEPSDLENTDGPIASNTPFPVFGALPVVGSYLAVRQPELFLKRPDTIRLRVSWFNLPPEAGGFRDYYRDYLIGLSGQKEPDLLNNATFRAGIRVENGGRWSLRYLPPACSDGRDLAYLFRTRDDCRSPCPKADGSLCDSTEFDSFRVDPARIPPDYEPSRGAIRIQLAGPPYGFGNALYTQNVLKAVLDDLPDPVGCRERCRGLCRPYLESLKVIQRCLDDCRDASDETYARCIMPRLAEGFLVAILGQLERCHDGASTPEATSLMDRIRVALEACRGKTDPELTNSLRLPREMLRERPAGTLASCLNKCEVILDILLEVLAQAAACLEAEGGPEKFKACFQAALAQYTITLDGENAKRFGACMEGCMKVKKKLKYPNPPYLPTATGVLIDYEATSEVLGGSPDDRSRFFHLLPFGGWDQPGVVAGQPTAMLPAIDHPGNLYLGFAGLDTPATQTLLFRMASGGGASENPAPIAWSCLANGRWAALRPEQIRSDTTNGLQNTGILTLRLPTCDTSADTILPGGLVWLRGSVAKAPGQFPMTVEIVPNVVTATRQVAPGEGEDLRRPLEAGTIQGSLEDLPGIATVGQPVKSFGGRAPEDDSEFQTRMGERLRHKDRAILSWDYERLVLERFPAVWKAKALPARSLAGGNSPGDVLVVIVAGPESTEVLDPTAPMATGETLGLIRTHLEDRTGPFIRLGVVNPNYVRIEVTTTVRFREDDDPGDQINRLDRDLIAYLSPWSATEGESQGRSEDEIADFIRNRRYVAAMLSIAFRYSPDPARLEWCYLTSARHHVIKVADDPSRREGRSAFRPRRE